MNFPSLQVLNFLDNPDDIVDYANTLSYEKDNYSAGKRTSALHEFDKTIFNNVNYRIMRLLYPDAITWDKITWNAMTYFHKIKYEDVDLIINNEKNPCKGWIHQDNFCKFTSITYLSKGKDNGTAIYSPKNVFDLKKDEDIKYDHYRGKEVDKEQFSKELNRNLDKYNVECMFGSSYNKMIGFDGSSHHGALYTMKPGEERLTLISFIKSINAPYFPMAEMRRISEL